MSSRYKLLQSDQNYYAFKEKNNSYFDGLTWKKVESSECSYILNNEIDVSVQAKRLGNILDYKYDKISNKDDNNIVNLTQFQFTNNYNVKPFHEYGIGDPSFINYCVSGNTYFYKPNTNGIINSGKFHEPDTFIFKSSTTENPYYECEDKAGRSNVPYFVVGNMNYSTTEASYNCYVPKFKNAYNTNIIKQLIDPISETINYIFDADVPNKITDNLSEYLDASQNEYKNYLFKNDAIPGTGNFLIYTEDIYKFFDVNPNSLGNIDEITREIQNVTSHTEYLKLYDGSLNPINMYNHFYKSNNDDLKTYFTNFNCLNLSDNTDFSVVKNNVASSDVPFNEKIREIYQQWKQLNYQNNNIINDISLINIIGKDRKAYLRELYKDIENQQNELKKLLNNSNGGIGRLKDQKYLRDNTILEINILILIIIFSLFLYSKIK